MTESPALSVLLFGIARDLTGQSSLPSPMPSGGRVGDLLDDLRVQYPALSGIKSLLIAVNGEYADADQQLHPTDEVAIIPPVSGG
jgi:molybdopterin converting factor small subunit